MSEHDRVAEAFRALRVVTDAGLRPPGAADAVVRYRKRRARRASAVSIAVVAVLFVALQSSPDRHRLDPGPAASHTATASPSTSPSPSDSPSPQATVTNASPQTASPAAGSRTAKPPPDYDCQRSILLAIRSTPGGYTVGDIAGTLSWNQGGPCATARIGVFWVVYSYNPSGPRRRENYGMQYVTIDSPTVFIPSIPHDVCRGDWWVIAQGLTIPTTIPASVTTWQALRQYFSSVGDSAIADGTTEPCTATSTPSP